MGMEKVPHFERLYRRGNSYIYRVSVPKDLRAFLDDRTEIKKSLRTDSLSEAKLRWAKMHDEVERELADAKHRAANANLPAREPSQSEIWEMVNSWRRERLTREQDTLSRVGPADFAGRIEQLREEDRLWRALGKVGRFHSMADDIIEFLCTRSGHVVPARDTPAYSFMADLVHRARADISQRIIALMEGNMNDVPPGHDTIFDHMPQRFDDQAPQALNPGSIAPRGLAGKTLGTLVEEYVEDPTRNAKSSTRMANRQKLSLLVAYFGSDRPIGSISGQEIGAFSKVLLALPTSPLQRYPGIALSEIPELASADKVGTMSRSNARIVLETASTFFRFYEKRGYIEKNPVYGYTISKSSNGDRPRRPFTVAELNTIFSAPIYVGCRDDETGFSRPGTNHPRRSRFWLPLIALFTGMRLGEICQLWSDDIEFANGVSVIHVRSNEKRQQKLKNAGSARTIPIHRTLVDIGLVEWARNTNTDGAQHLFPEIAYNEVKQNYSDTFSKRFANFLKSQDLHGDGRTFHSFRHTFRDAVRDANLSDGLAKALGGWADHEAHSGYGSGYQIDRLAEGIERLEFRHGEEVLNLAHLLRNP